ncbi:MAG: right-handed parallel beta-helix repeat-containing protein [Chloroflexi bacterium]|nr:right-handed parallel beta-helix repeat-containing protein [Chloroflexota bacterium]
MLSSGGEFYADQINVTSNTGAAGGGIALAGTIFEIRNSTFMDNTGHGNGGALNIQNGSTGAIINTSIFGNHSVVTGSSFYPGGGLFVYGPADVDLIHSTITGNHNSAYGGGLSVYNTSAPTAPLTITNSVVSGNGTNFAAPDCYLFPSTNPKVAFAGMTMFGEIDQYCAVGGDPAVTIGEVDLGPLTGAYIGFAIPLANGSAAINAAPSCPAELLGVDQAGEVRPVGPACDLGAMEHFAGKSGTLDVSPTSGEPLSSFTITVNDLDLVAVSTIDVQAITRNTLYPDSETITLTETAPGSGEFTALVLLGAVLATPNNGTIEAGLGHEVAVSYYDTVTADADDATLEAAYTVAALPAANLLTNGDFELGPSSWTIVATNGDKVKSQNPFDGLKAFKFKGGAGKLPASLSQTVLNPAVANGNTLYAQAMISSGPAASGKMLLNIKTSSGRQVKASVVYAKNGAYALHFIQVPLVLDSGETVIKALLRFTDASQSGKVHVDAVSLSVQVPNDPRASSRSGVMLPPPQPDGFRGQN